jgi:dienelactone hydrolase
VVRCAPDSSLSLPSVQTEVSAKGITTPMTSAVALYRIAFRTERGDGSAGVSTARVYLPQTPRALPLPVITVGHPTDGIADSCAPSEDPGSNQDLALPWAGLGYAVIVADYAGLGNEGAQSYLDNHDQGQAVLDAARALRKLMGAGVFSNQVLAVGFSQGGGAVLSAQALARSYGADGDLVGVIAFAPEWPTRLNSFGMVDQLENPSELTIETGYSAVVIEVMRSYGYFYNRLGPAHADDGFPAAHRSGIDGAVNSLCQIPLGGYLQSPDYLQIGAITDPALRTGLLACIQQGEQASGCVDPGKSYFDYLNANFVTADPQGAKVLFVQGLSDTVMVPASEAACNLDKLRSDGVSPQVCTDGLGQHTTVVARNIDFAIQWAQALLAGAPLPSCDGSGMPGCIP